MKNKPLLTAKQTVLLITFLALSGIGIWQSILPYLAERHFRDGFNYDAGKRYKYAIEELEQAIHYAPWETHYQAQLGRTLEAYAKAVKYPQEKIRLNLYAFKIYEKTIELDQFNPWYKNRLSSVAMELAELVPDKKEYYTNLAEEQTRLAAEIDNKNPLFQLNYAFFLHQTRIPEKVDAAIPYYKKVLEYDPRMVEANYNLADIYRQHGEYDKVIEEYLKLYKKNPNFKNINIAIASTYLTLNKPQESIPYFKKELESNPSQVDSLKNLAILFYKDQNWKESAYYYNQLFNYHSNMIPAYFRFYVQALVNDGQISTAIKELEVQIKNNPKDTYSKEQLSKIRAQLKRKN